MLSGPLLTGPVSRRRGSRPALAVAAASAVSDKLRLGAFGRLYGAAGIVLVLLILPGSQLLVYPILWILMPDELAPSTPQGPAAGTPETPWGTPPR